MLVTADQLVLHVIGDYVLQSQWMATEKVTKTRAALAHVALYTLPFLVLSQSVEVLLTIAGTHFVIDRWRLARHVCWFKNFLAPPGSNPSWKDCSGTGYPANLPPWLSTWLLIITDNLMHILCNGLAIKYLLLLLTKIQLLGTGSI
jgi:hypothetical protein